MIFVRPLRRVFLLALIAIQAACSSGPTREPAKLLPLAESIGLGQTWQNTVSGRVDFPLQIAVSGRLLAAATSRGTLAVIDASTGQDVWRARIDAEISSGVGFDGKIAALTTIDNELVAFGLGLKNQPVIAWRKTLQARVYTAPVVAGGRVFVLAGDRTVQAFDISTGAKIWNLQRASEPLILSQAGTLGVYQNTLLVGHSGRLLGVNPDSGLVQWELSVATSRATNDIERLIDLVGTPHRVGDTVCVRSFQTNVACIDLLKNAVLWSKPSQGSTPVSGDASITVSAESDGRVKAWKRASGELLWTNEKLLYRNISAPLVVGNSVIVGDFDGFVHVMNKQTGEFTARFKSDGSAIVAAPVVLGNVVVVATAKGGLFAYSPK